MIRTFVLAAALAMALGSAAQAQSDLVKRGDYLVNTNMTCGNCHSPKGAQGDIPPASTRTASTSSRPWASSTTPT